LIKVEKENHSMWLGIILGGYPFVACVIAVWSVGVAYAERTKPEVRSHAYRIFRVAWTTGVVSGVAGLLRLHVAGVL
jgi:hypothetical protein